MLFRLCGKVGPPQSLASFENKDVAVRQAGRRPYAAAITGADTPKFRKQSYTFCNVEKLRRNSLVLQFQIFRIKIDAKVDMIDEEYSSGSIFSKNNFDKI